MNHIFSIYSIYSWGPQFLAKKIPEKGANYVFVWDNFQLRNNTHLVHG